MTDALVLPPAAAQAILAQVRPLVVEVGAQMHTFADDWRAQTPKAGVDVVTKADHFSEAALTSALARLYPDHRIASEEGTRMGPTDSPWTWHLDPLDGTANYSRGLPYWTISLGLAYGDQPVLGLVHGPACGLDLHGAVGLGAWNHDRALPGATPAGEVKTWIVATDWPWDLDERRRTNRFLDVLAPQIRQYKTYGSAAVDLAHVANGAIDAYAISHIFPWDQAGGTALLRALGYELRRWSGEPWDLRHADIVACRPGMWPVLGTATAG